MSNKKLPSGKGNSKTLQQNNTTKLMKFSSKECFMALSLMKKPCPMSNMRGDKKCGANPYQYVMSLRRKNIEINKFKDIQNPKSTYRLFYITDKKSRQILNVSLARYKKSPVLSPK